MRIGSNDYKGRSPDKKVVSSASLRLLIWCGERYEAARMRRWSTGGKLCASITAHQLCVVDKANAWNYGRMIRVYVKSLEEAEGSDELH